MRSFGFVFGFFWTGCLPHAQTSTDMCSSMGAPEIADTVLIDPSTRRVADRFVECGDFRPVRGKGVHRRAWVPGGSEIGWGHRGRTARYLLTAGTPVLQCQWQISLSASFFLPKKKCLDVKKKEVNSHFVTCGRSTRPKKRSTGGAGIRCSHNFSRGIQL